jgi:hypothetical protein
MTEIDNPFDGEAARLFHGQGVKEQQARDAVVLRYLKDGNTEALAHWLMSDYRPGATVAVFLSYMLQPERQVNGDPRNVVTSDPNIIPYQLIATNRHGHRGRKPSNKRFIYSTDGWNRERRPRQRHCSFDRATRTGN